MENYDTDSIEKQILEQKELLDVIQSKLIISNDKCNNYITLRNEIVESIGKAKYYKEKKSHSLMMIYISYIILLFILMSLLPTLPGILVFIGGSLFGAFKYTIDLIKVEGPYNRLNEALKKLDLKHDIEFNNLNDLREMRSIIEDKISHLESSMIYHNDNNLVPVKDEVKRKSLKVQ